MATTLPPTKKPAAKPARKAVPIPRLSTRDGKGGDGVACVQNIVNNDRQTHMLLAKALYCRENARRAGRTNAALSTILDKTVASYTERQQRLGSSKLLKTSVDVTQWTKSWTDKLKSALSGPGVGVLPLAVPIVGALLVGAGLTAAVWYAFSKDEPKSAADVMTAFHASEVYGQMAPEAQAAADKAIQDASQGGYKEGKDAADASLFGQLKTVALVLGGGYLLMQLMGNRKGG